MSGHDEPEGYEGEVTLAVEGTAEGTAEGAVGGAAGVGGPTTAHAVLAARFDPLAGHVVWTGRVAADVAPRTVLLLTTPYGTARAEATERDVWGNTRVTGLDRPPFPVELLDGAGLDGAGS